MKYSYFIGLFENLTLSGMQWVFVFVLMLLLLIGISAFISYGKTTPQKKTIYVLIYLAVSLLLGGVISIVVVALIHFITYAFISDFRTDYL